VTPGAKPVLLSPEQGPESQHIRPVAKLGFQSTPVQLLYLTHAALQAATVPALLTMPQRTLVFAVSVHEIVHLPATPYRYFTVYLRKYFLQKESLIDGILLVSKFGYE